MTQPDGSDADDEDLRRYEVVLSGPDGSSLGVSTALADLGDGDNNHLLCFDVADDPRKVRFSAGFLTDPRDGFNPHMCAPVSR